MEATISDAPIRPPLYRGSGLLGTLGEFQKDPLTAVERISKLGDLVEMRMPVPGIHALFITSPELAEHLLVTKARSYGKITRGYQVLRKLLGNGLVTSDGAFWLRQRRIAQPAFHKERIAKFGDTMTRLSLETIDRWQPKLQTGDRFDIHAEMMHLTLRIVSETLLSTDVTGSASTVGGALEELLTQVIYRATRPWAMPDFVPTAANRRFFKARAALDEVVLKMIAERRRTNTPGDDLLGLLLEAKDPENGEGMNDLQLRDEVMTIFLAGHETTANALSFSLWLLGKNPHAEETLRAELQQVLDGRVPTAADFARLPYTLAVVREALRLYPPVWIVGRGALEDDVIGNTVVKKGTLVFVSPWVMHRDATAFPDPLAFTPERWLSDETKHLHKCRYMPFITGPRKCIGDGFALMEAVLVLATLLPRVKLEPQTAQLPALFASVTLRPKEPMWMKAVHPR